MKKRFGFLFSDGASGQGSGAGAGAGAAAGAGAGDGSGAAAGTGGGSGGQGGGQSGGEQAYTGPFYADPQYAFDPDTQRFFEGKNYPDVKTALSSLRHADEAARSRNVITKPDLAKLNEWSGWSELGWIDNAEKYGAAVTKPTLKDGEMFDDAGYNALVKAGHEARVLPSQLTAIVNALHTNEQQQITNLRNAGAEANAGLDQALRDSWGNNYDKNKELAKRAFAHFEVDKITGAQLDSVLSAPGMVKLFHAIGAAMGEGNLVDVNGGGNNLAGDHPDALNAELNRLEQDAETVKIMRDERHPRYREVTEKRRDLITRLANAQKRTGRAA
ncbi:hypothetical protein [Afipia felis]|uniref:Uncharacterized protein n=2 Tax=Afipia felis TaxID=1035 RepID=A0A380W5K9_AFIFE|nr:hypothetical protein [Afipia felis]EKS26514.1 hypothetical protein HMPREF9697_04030 [Afipia felis ATCC 53690]SUU76164.1 Uncharacterised protein [Afipia felis]SUU84231.1 Uncharacterised protein [Afipia felis]